VRFRKNSIFSSFKNAFTAIVCNINLLSGDELRPTARHTVNPTSNYITLNSLDSISIQQMLHYKRSLCPNFPITLVQEMFFSKL
jgi:hypothetical protein